MSGKDLLPPLARITPQDQRGVLWIIATICLVFIYLTLAARAFVRWRRFQPDDFAIFAACVLVLAQTSVSYAAVGLGLGLSRLTVSEDDVKIAWQLFIASEVLFIVAIFTAKTAVLLTIRKILPPDIRLRTALKFTIWVVGALGLASVLGITIKCGSNSLFVQAEGRCSSWPRWTGVAIADASTDLWGFGLFCWVIWPLQMRTSYKCTSTGLIGLRLLCMAFTGLHVYYVYVFEQSKDPAVDVIRPLVWQQLALTYSLMSAMSIALRPFFREFHSGMGMDVGHFNDDKYGRGSTVHDSLQVNVLPSNRDSWNENATPARAGESSLLATSERYRGADDDTHYEAAVSQGSPRAALPTQDFIRRDVEYVVTYDTICAYHGQTPAGKSP